MTTAKTINFNLSTLLVAIGALLLIAMIVIEDEPGAIPLFLIVLGLGLRLYKKFKGRNTDRN